MITNDKQTMRIAMIGVSPADQVTFKGYLRVLLRLDADLEWVSATHSNVDLFVINEEFRHASSVLRVIEQHPRASLLYVGKSTTAEGQLVGNLLTMPLKQIKLLHDWLISNVAVLKGVKVAPSTQKVEPAKTQATQVQAPVQPTQASEPKAVDVSFNDIIDLIGMLNKRHSGLCELVQDGQVIAIINPATQQLWANQNIRPKASSAWRLRLAQHTPTLNPTHALDMSQWLWDVVWDHAGNLVRLVNGSSTYQIRSWVKPQASSRRDLLRIMSAMEKSPVSVAQIASISGVSLSVVQKAVAGLLVANCLSDNSYRNLKVYTSGTSEAPMSSAMPSAPARPEPTATSAPDSQAQDEKLGFLARLRRKLGL